MEFFKPGSLNIDFMGKRKPFVFISIVLLLVSIVTIFWKQANGTINLGIDFAGGTVLDFEFSKEVEIGQLRKIIQDLGYDKNVIQRSALESQEGKSEYIIRVERIAILSANDADRLKSGLEQDFGEKLMGFSFDADSGDQFDLRFGSEVEEKDIRVALAGQAESIGRQELLDVSIKKQGKESEHRYLVLMTGIAAQIEKALQDSMPEAKPFMRKVEFVGPQVGKKLRNDGILSLIYAIAGILAYVAFRFNLQFAPGAVLALAHDAILTIGFFTIFGLEFNLTFVAAVLTVIGYSVNDTIVVYDRIRENMTRIRSQPIEKVMNTSINETLNRTILTSFTTALALMGLLVVGFGEIKDFAIAMTFGLVVGTYSTIYIASSSTIFLENIMKKFRSA